MPANRDPETDAQRQELEQVVTEMGAYAVGLPIGGSAKQMVLRWANVILPLLSRLAAQERQIETLRGLLSRAIPEHDATCAGACMDDDPEHCLTLHLIAEINAALASPPEEP